METLQVAVSDNTLALISGAAALAAKFGFEVVVALPGRVALWLERRRTEVLSLALTAFFLWMWWALEGLNFDRIGAYLMAAGGGLGGQEGLRRWSPGSDLTGPIKTMAAKRSNGKGEGK